MREPTPQMKEQRVALLCLQQGERMSDASTFPEAVDPLVERSFVDACTEQRDSPEAALLGAVVAAQQVGRDPVEPRSRVGRTALKAPAALEGNDKDVGSKIVGRPAADSSREVPVDRREVALEYDREAMGLAQRLLDDLGV
jgi:hypothetical protein